MPHQRANSVKIHPREHNICSHVSFHLLIKIGQIPHPPRYCVKFPLSDFHLNQMPTRGGSSKCQMPMWGRRLKVRIDPHITFTYVSSKVQYLICISINTWLIQRKINLILKFTKLLNNYVLKPTLTIFNLTLAKTPSNRFSNMNPNLVKLWEKSSCLPYR